MTASPTLHLHQFFTPLPREGLFDPGDAFAAAELTRRVLSLFWRDCCCPPYFMRAPAPVFQLDSARLDEPGQPIRAWWLTVDGIVSEPAGPHAPALRPYLAVTLPPERLWPRYDFRILAIPFDVEMMFHRSAVASQGHRTRLFVQPDGRVRVLTRSPWWVG